jgi:alkylhydroperoxidase family enzyme
MSYLATVEPPTAMRTRDLDNAGFVMNLTRVWAHHPSLHKGLFELLDLAARAASLTFRQRGVLVVACASTLGDPYCSLAWGKKLAGVAGAELAAGVLRGDDEPLDPTERALARWARVMTRDPNATEPGDVEPLREAGYDDAQILAITAFVALRAAFATVNDALGVQPDRELSETAPPAVRDAVDTIGHALR